MVSMKMTPAQHAQFLALGGSRWVKSMLAMANYMAKPAAKK